MGERPGRAGDDVNAPADSETATTETLLGDDVATYEAVVNGEASGPLAVCSPPFGGRERVLERAADRLGTDVLQLDPGDDAATIRSALGDGPVVVDNCQHLYERRIGGFAPLDEFLRAVLEYGDVVVTGWNTYAWTYLSQVRGIDRTFAAQAAVEATVAEDLAALVLERYDEMPEFTAEQSDTSGLFAVERREVDWRGRTLSVPVPNLNRAALARTVGDGDVDPKDVVFERLAAVSRGNVGVATAIWEASRREDLRPSDIVAAGTDLQLDREEAFCLRIVLLKERVTRAEVTRIVDEAERVLGRLRRAGIVTTADDVVQLEPTAVPTAVSTTERRGLQ